MRVVTSWSGGKDSCLALHLAKEQGNYPMALLSVMDESGDYSRSNGVHKSVLEAQAKSLGLAIKFVNSSWSDYQDKLTNQLKELRQIYQIEGVVFGDIDTSDHREFNEQICQASGLNVVMPLWGLSRQQVIDDNRRLGIKSKICVVSNKYPIVNLLTKEFVDLDFVQLQDLGIDICGENGEFHTMVYDASLFKDSLNLDLFEIHDLPQVKLAEYRVLE